jgi:hypothetical protein
MNDTDTQTSRRTRHSNDSDRKRCHELRRVGLSCGLTCTGLGAGARTERSEGPQRKRPRRMGLFLCHTCEHPQGAAK